jgi:D-alanyl-D-alanine carboxypeptidase
MKKRVSPTVVAPVILAALAVIAVGSCESSKANPQISSNLADMPVIRDPSWYDNPNVSRDQSAGSPLGGLLDSSLSSAISEGIPGVAILARTPGEGTWASAAGSIDLRNGIPMKPNSVSRVGSITKMFTAVVILQLMEEGALALDDPISKFLPAEVIRGIQNADSATIRQLLNHSSGIASYSDHQTIEEVLTRGSNRDQTSLRMLDLVRGLPASFTPGADCNYSNTGYILLGLVAETVTGRAMETSTRKGSLVRWQ